MIEKEHLSDWSPEKDSPSQDSDHPDDLFQSKTRLNLFQSKTRIAIERDARLFQLSNSVKCD